MLQSSEKMFTSSQVHADPLSDLLRLAGAEAVVTGEFRAGGAWAMHFPVPQGLKFTAITKGEAWLRLDGQSEVRKICAGTVVLMNTTSQYVLASDLGVPAAEAVDYFHGQDPFNRVVVYQGGEDYQQMGGHIHLDFDLAKPLAEVIPECVTIVSDVSEVSTLNWLIAQLAKERTERIPGHRIVSSQLAHMLFVQALRMFLNQGLPSEKGNWLRAMNDPRLAPALRCMHADPARNWNLEDLASAAAMSRTAFAVKFKEVAGTTPLNYLTQWRMMLAQERLRSDELPFGAWIEEIGYGSESAFSHAFKRIVGVSPNQYRQSQG